MNKDIQLFGILDFEDKWFISLNDDGTFVSGTYEDAKKLDIILLEKWLNTIKLYKIVYKVKAFQIEKI